MTRASLPRTVAALAALVLPLAAAAHEGHGLPGAAHWHATDALGLLAVVVAAAAAWWWRGR